MTTQASFPTVLSNPIALTSLPLSSEESALFYCLLSKVDHTASINPDTPYQLTFGEYEAATLSKVKHTRRQLLIAVERLHERSITLPVEGKPRNRLLVHLFLSIELSPEGIIAVWHPSIVPYISALLCKYTSIALGDLIPLTPLQRNFLFYIKAAKFTKSGEKVTLEALRKVLSMTTKYPTFKAFNAKVLKPCVEVAVSLGVLKGVDLDYKGRYVVGVTWRFTEYKTKYA